MNLGCRVTTSMPPSAVRKGDIGQFAWLATALATGKARSMCMPLLLIRRTATAEIRRHLKPAPGISIQVKVA